MVPQVGARQEEVACPFAEYIDFNQDDYFAPGQQLPAGVVNVAESPFVSGPQP